MTTSCRYVIPDCGQLSNTALLAEWGVSWCADYQAADDESEPAFTVIDAMAVSGDCFVTLATRLDCLAQGLERDSAEQIELEHLVTTLFYLQDRYDIVAKHKRP